MTRGATLLGTSVTFGGLLRTWLAQAGVSILAHFTAGALLELVDQTSESLITAGSYTYYI